MSASRTSARALALRHRRAAEVEIGDLEPALQLDEQPLRGALADAGHEHERVEIVVGEAAAQRVGLCTDRIASASFGPTPVAAISASNVSRSSRVGKP